MNKFTYQTIDITNRIDYDTKFKYLVDLIANSSDALNQNYKGLEKSFFDCVTITVNENDDIVALSGLQTSPNKWGKYIGRIFSRMIIHPDYRYKSNYLLGETISFTETMLPIQLEYAKKLELDSVFFSRETGYKSAIGLARKIESRVSGITFIVPNDKYNVCGKMQKIPDSCKQYVAIYHLTTLGQQRWDEQNLIVYE